MKFLIETFYNMDWRQPVMWLIGGILIFLAIKKEMEPALLLPIGFGAILVNIPLSNVLTSYECQTCHEVYSSLVEKCKECGGTLFAPAETGIIEWLYEIGIEASEALPILLFIGIGAMIDFEPLIVNPKLMILGAFAQLGIFLTIILAVLCRFNISDAASVGIIGAADGPTSILVAKTLGSGYLGAIVVVAYSYMALVPIIQPAVIKCITSKKRTTYPHGIQGEKGQQNRQNSLSDSYNHGRGTYRPEKPRARRIFDVRQPA